MKKTLAKSLRSLMALTLALVMVLGVVGPAFAAETNDDALDKLIEVLEEYGPDVAKAAYNYVDGHGYIDAVQDSISGLKAALSEYAENHTLVAAKIKDALAGPVAQLKELKAQAENLIVLIALFKAGGFSGSEGEAAPAAVITIPGFGTVDTDKVDVENFDISQLTPEQKEAIDNSGLLGDIKLDDLTDEQVEALKEAGLKGEINPDAFTEEELEQLQQAQDKLNEVVEQIDKTEAQIENLQNKLNQIENKIAELKDAIANTEDLAATVANILKQGVVAGTEKTLELYVAARDALFASLEGIEKPYIELYELTVDTAELAADIALGTAELVAFITSDVLTTLYNNRVLVAGAFVLAAEQLGVSQETLEAAAAKVQELAPVAIEKIKTFLSNLKAAIYRAYKAATTADYEVDYDSYYVAIGDATANADESYVDLLADELDLIKGAYDKSMTDAYLIQDTVLDAEKIAQADLITIGYSTANFIGDLADAIQGEEIEWELYLPETGVKAIDVVMDEVEAYVEAFGFGVNTAKALTAAIENIAFNSLAYAYNLPATISDIRAINPDAVLVVVGLDNPLENCSVSHNGHTVGIDKLMDGVLALTDLYTLAYAMLASNCTFVAAPNAANDAEGTVIEVTDLIPMVTRNFEELLPNAQGQKYIQERIYNALNVTCAYLWGDVNLDALVDYQDAVCMLRYDVGLTTADQLYMPVFDVNADGLNDYNDAVAVLRYDVGLITKFPAEG